MKSSGPKIPGKRTEPKQIADILAPGDVIYVTPKDEKNLAGVWSLVQIPEVSGGLIAMDPHTGRVLAVVGGFSFSMSQFDRALQAKRQPGSSFKPFVFAAAIDNGYKPTSIVLDAPIEIEQGPGQDIWKPSNYEKDQSGGPTTLRVGVEKSRNQMTVRLAQDMGMPIITEYAKRFGIYDDLLPVLSMSLGAGETTLLRMATAYCMIANGGKTVRPTLIDRIQDRWGKSVWRHDARECVGCAADQWASQEEPDIPGRPQGDHRPAHRLSDDLHHGRRHPARHGDVAQVAEPPARRQDRHDQRGKGRLVRRLLAGPRRRCHRIRVRIVVLDHAYSRSIFMRQAILEHLLAEEPGHVHLIRGAARSPRRTGCRVWRSWAPATVCRAVRPDAPRPAERSIRTARRRPAGN